MTNTIIITDRENTKREVEIPTIENVLSINITIKSGDEILTVKYKDDTPNLRVDTGDFIGGRLIGFNDGSYCISVKDIEKFNEISLMSTSKTKSYLKQKTFVKNTEEYDIFNDDDYFDNYEDDEFEV